MKNFQNISPETFSLSAVAVGFLIVEDTNTANEQNAIGNWLMLVSQLLCTNAALKQLANSNTNNLNNINNNINYDDKETLKMLQKMVEALNTEIAEIKKKL